MLSNDSLTIIYRSRSYQFDLSYIKQITFESRKLMFPLILGGTASAFILISILNNLFNPWLSLSLLLLSLAVAYLGWMGTNVLTIKESGHNNDFMLKHVSINMRSFIGYVNKMIRFKKGLLPPQEMLVYHISIKTDWEKALLEQTYKHESLDKEGFIHASDYHQLLSTAERYYSDEVPLVLLAIDPEKLKSPIKYELATSRDSLFPHIFGPINLEAVVQALPFEKNDSGKFSFPKPDIQQNN
ncbi:DUF952 domain-containing protein [Fulvivirgaceae bacterium BMA12]|uniref:DUF952 domain-containing protein n=1 Tax=Agaribacillus aureus TaxID=3051825 RepID=A0ABT8L329_9BACT|nr:DUF952 domain-containing protein [Fulvivirgaceae bacterium BMA12]